MPHTSHNSLTVESPAHSTSTSNHILEASPINGPPRTRSGPHLEPTALEVCKAWNHEAEKQTLPATPEDPSHERPPATRLPVGPTSRLPSLRRLGSLHQACPEAPQDPETKGLLHTHPQRRGGRRKRPASPRHRREVTSGATLRNPGAGRPGNLRIWKHNYWDLPEPRLLGLIPRAPATYFGWSLGSTWSLACVPGSVAGELSSLS